MVYLVIERMRMMSNNRIELGEGFFYPDEKKWHIDIDHGHIESIDNIEHGDIDTHHHSF